MRICLFLYERLHLRMFNLQSKIIIFLICVICVICGENCGEKKSSEEFPESFFYFPYRHQLDMDFASVQTLQIVFRDEHTFET